MHLYPAQDLSSLLVHAWVFSWCSGFLLQSQNMIVLLIDLSTLTLCKYKRLLHVKYSVNKKVKAEEIAYN